jgi:ElaB/YqjD/DUF883 family membrane-anchored ribosome-binding protein
MSAENGLDGRSGDEGSLADELARAESDVERARQRVAQSMMALRQEVARQVDWRSWVQRRPLLFVGGALALGFWVGNRR